MDNELIGDLAGPRQLKEPGSPGWCLQTVLYLKDHVRHVDEQWRQADQVLTELMQFRAWEVIPPGQPYGTLDVMLKAEVGLPAEMVKALIRQARLAAHGGDRRSSQFQADNVSLKSNDFGNSETYTLRRLRRDRPELAEQVERGELSAHAAGIEAGFQHRAVSVRVTDPRSVERSLRKHMSPENLVELIRLLTAEED